MVLRFFLGRPGSFWLFLGPSGSSWVVLAPPGFPGVSSCGRGSQVPPEVWGCLGILGLQMTLKSLGASGDPRGFQERPSCSIRLAPPGPSWFFLFPFGGVCRSHEGPGEARESQWQPGGARSSQEGPRVVWRSMEEPGGAKETGGARGCGKSLEEPGVPALRKRKHV